MEAFTPVMMVDMVSTVVMPGNQIHTEVHLKYVSGCELSLLYSHSLMIMCWAAGATTEPLFTVMQCAPTFCNGHYVMETSEKEQEELYVHTVETTV